MLVKSHSPHECRTTKWCLYNSPVTSLSVMLQPILDGRQRNAATDCVAQVIKDTAGLARNRKVHQPVRWLSGRRQNSKSRPAFCGRTASVVPNLLSLRSASDKANVGVSWCAFHSSWQTFRTINFRHMEIGHSVSHLCLWRHFSSKASSPCYFH